MQTLEEISKNKFPRTDKGKFADGDLTRQGHNYWEVYDEYFLPFRDKEINFIEFGFGAHGDCLRTFAEYFSNAKNIVGADHNRSFVDDLVFEDERIKRFWVNQHEVKTIDDLKDNISDEGIEFFDIVIDDGNHSTQSITNCFAKFFPLVSEGGIYVIEDTYDLVEKTLQGQLNILSLLQVCANEDELEDWKTEVENVQSVHTYRGLVFIKKGKNITR